MDMILDPATPEFLLQLAPSICLSCSFLVYREVNKNKFEGRGGNKEMGQ